MAIREEIVAVPSIAGVQAQNRWMRQEEPASEKLLVMLPGRNYFCDTGVLFYLKSMAVQKGYDVLALEYGFQVSRTAPDREATIAEVQRAVEQVLSRGYRYVCFAGKSLGSPLAVDLARAHRSDVILLTPLQDALGPAEGRRTLAIIGTADPVYPAAECQAARERGDMEWLVLEGLNHGLLHDLSWEESVKALPVIIGACERFLP